MSATLWVTNKCNLRCKYCYEGEKNNIKMNKKIIPRILDFLIENNYVMDGELISFHGGEPFLEFDIIKRFIKLVEDKKIKLSYAITTNGTILTDEILYYIKKYNIDLSISLDGDKKVNDINRLTKNDSSVFNTVLKNINILVNNNVSFRIRATFTSETINYLFDSVNFLVDLGCKCITFAPNEYDRNFSDKDMSILKEEIFKINKKYKSKNEISINVIDNNNCFKNSCSFGLKNININSNGELYPCIRTVGINEFKIGNIFKGVKLSKINNLTVEYSNDSEQFICNKCDNKFFCDGYRCLIINKVVNGDMYKPLVINCVLENIKNELL